MRHELVGRGIRALRHRRGLRQRDLADRAHLARSVVADMEAGRLECHSLGALIRLVDAAGGSIRIDLHVPGGDVYRLLDADHAAIQNAWKAILDRGGWAVDAEVTFNHFGERGSIDLLAWHAPTRLLLVIEIKTRIIDVQSLLAGMDRKVRIGRSIANDRGWRPAAAIPMLLVAEGSTARRRVSEHAALFAPLSVRGRSAASWLRSPAVQDAPSGLLVVTKLPEAHRGDRRRAGRQRIRKPRA